MKHECQHDQWVIACVQLYDANVLITVHQRNTCETSGSSPNVPKRVVRAGDEAFCSFAECLALASTSVARVGEGLALMELPDLVEGSRPPNTLALSSLHRQLICHGGYPL